MKIDPKDRSQLLRMAGNIAGGLLAADPDTIDSVAVLSAQIAIETLETVDKEIAERNKDATQVLVGSDGLRWGDRFKVLTDGIWTDVQLVAAQTVEGGSIFYIPEAAEEIKGVEKHND